MWNEPAKSSSCPFFASSPTSSSPPNFLHQDHPSFLQELLLHRENGQISNPISIITYVPRIPTLLSTTPPPLLWPWDSRSIYRTQEGKGRARDLEYPGGAQVFRYKTCHVADREGFATWGNQGWVTWVSPVCPVVCPSVVRETSSWIVDSPQGILAQVIIHF